MCGKFDFSYQVLNHNSYAIKNPKYSLLSTIFDKKVMEEYFKDVEEESIRDNFVICYELMDELVDFGYPQTTDGKILQEYITQEG